MSFEGISLLFSLLVFLLLSLDSFDSKDLRDCHNTLDGIPCQSNLHKGQFCFEFLHSKRMLSLECFYLFEQKEDKNRIKQLKQTKKNLHL